MSRSAQKNMAALSAVIRLSLCCVVIASAVRGVDRFLAASSPIPFNVFADGLPRVDVRAELVRIQAQEGLTLASFYRGVHFVNFADRSQTQTEQPFAGGNAVEGEGVISRDGTEIAFDLYRSLGKTYLGIVHLDGSGLEEFPNIAAPSRICWSSDKSSLAISVPIPATQYKPLYMSLVVLRIATKETQEIGTGGYVSSQCWSPDGKQIVYEADGNIRVNDINNKESRVLAKGKYPTWSSDGRWLAFLDNDTYYAVTPSGLGRKVLFKEKEALSGLWWSPDSRIVAYLSRNGALEGPPRLMDVGLVRLRVKRLEDDSGDWVVQLSDAFLPNYQWVANPQLFKRAGPEATSH